MKSWKKFSLYHILKSRRENEFMRQTTEDFISGICKIDGLSASIAIPVNIVCALLSSYFDLTFMQFLILDTALFASITIVVSAIDTYMTRKIRIRTKAIKSIKYILGIKRSKW